jgi:hypothetical protein
MLLGDTALTDAKEPAAVASSYVPTQAPVPPEAAVLSPAPRTAAHPATHYLAPTSGGAETLESLRKRHRDELLAHRQQGVYPRA